MNKKKIAFVIWDIGNTGGAQRVIGLVANELCSEYEVHVVNLYGYPEKRGPSIPLDPRVKVVYLGHGTMPRLRKAIAASFNPLRKYLKREKIDICFLQTTYMGIIGAPVALWNKVFGGRRRTRFVFHDHGAVGAQLNDRSIVGIRWVSAKIADYTIVLTLRSASDYVKKLHIPARKIRVITNWIDPAINPEGIRADLAAKKIVWAGRFSKEKGVLRIPEIARLVLPDFPDWSWHIYGDGSQREELEEKIAEYSLGDQVILEGKSGALYAELPKYSIGTLTSDMEGMPMFLLEATAFHMPCVSFNVVTGPNEIIDDGTTGFLVKPFEIHKFASKLKFLMESEKRRRIFSDAQRDVQYKFSAEAIAVEWKNFLNEIG
ncbi:MAG: glycosyltransferase [Arcanobacterium sp.]|nr:glycosyltransferase [Arcanobacterium sp.]